MKHLFSLLGCALLLMAPASSIYAQNEGQQRGPRAVTPPPAQSQARVQTREASHFRVITAPRNSSKWHAQRQDVVRTMVQHEHTYRLRLARIERMQELYRGRGRMDRVRELDRLRTQLRETNRLRNQDCRAVLGEGDYLRLQERIGEHTRLRDRDRLLDKDRIQLRDQDRDRLNNPSTSTD